MISVTVDIVSVLSRLEQGLPSSTTWSQNKVVFVGVGVYVLDPSLLTSPTRGHAKLKIAQRIELPPQTEVLVICRVTKCVK